MKLFTASAFEDNAKVIKFKPTVTVASKPAKRKSKKKKLKDVHETTLANKLTAKLVSKKVNTNSPKAAVKSHKIPGIQSGRIEKKKQQLQHGKQSKKFTLSPGLLSKAVQQLQEQPVDEMEMETEEQPAIGGNSAFEWQLKQRLKGGRFRYINEQLYTMDSQSAEQLFKNDATLMGAYHAGYRSQVAKWPLNPLQRIIKMVMKLPKSLEIGDFGCGEGILAKSVPHRVHSIDLASCRDDIIACDMANTSFEMHSLDVIVYCLSLMGLNLKDYLLEANRVLKLNGLVFIAEIQSRFENVKQFVHNLNAYGFQLLKQDQDQNQKFFYFFQFKKVRHVGKIARLPELKLKPCLYKKR